MSDLYRMTGMDTGLACTVERDGDRYFFAANGDLLDSEPIRRSESKPCPPLWRKSGSCYPDNLKELPW